MFWLYYLQKGKIDFHSVKFKELEVAIISFGNMKIVFLFVKITYIEQKQIWYIKSRKKNQ